MEPKKEFECCPPFDPIPWEDKTVVWENKKFIKDKVMTFFYMPLNFGQVMKKISKKLEQSGAEVPDYLALSEHTSKWKMDIYVAVDKEVEGAENVTLSGTFYSKVYEGPFSDTGKWCKNYDETVKTKGLSIHKEYMWYTTCPKCAKKYGKNYTVIISSIQ